MDVRCTGLCGTLTFGRLNRLAGLWKPTTIKIIAFLLQVNVFLMETIPIIDIHLDCFYTQFHFISFVSYNQFSYLPYLSIIDTSIR